MRKAFGSVVALVISALIISTIISFFTRDTFEDLSLKSSSAPVKLTRRMQETTFAVSTEYVSRYDYNWLSEKMHILKGPKAGRILPVPVNFYVSNGLNHAEYPVEGLSILDGDCNILEEKIAPTRQYLKSLNVFSGEGKKQPFHVSSYRAVPEGVTLRYSDATPRAAKCLGAQLMALGEISFLQDSVSLVLPAYHAFRVNLQPYERTAMIADLGRNIYTALAEAYKKNPAHKVRILLTNSIAYPYAQTLPFQEIAGQFVGLTPDELLAIKASAIARNGTIALIPDIEKRIEIGLDLAVIWQLWQTPKVPFFKDASGEALLYEDMVLSLRRMLTITDAAGVIQNRKLKVIYASYARDNDEKKKWGESINLPYQRSSTERLMKLQVQMLLDVYDFSAVGLEPETFIALEMPSRQKFPLLHTIVRPLARKLGFQEKKDGSDISEVENSLRLIRGGLAQAGK
jgi:hypothetical protein